MAMSDVQTGQFMLAARLNSMDLDSLVVVGDEVGTVPSQASGSMKPRTMSRALARGVPSGFFDHLSNMRLVKVLDGSASFVVSKVQTWLSKNDCNSFTLAALN